MIEQLKGVDEALAGLLAAVQSRADQTSVATDLLVVEWTTMAAPWSSGRQMIVAAVLSIISGMPSSRPIVATSATGKARSLGLGSDSPK